MKKQIKTIRAKKEPVIQTAEEDVFSVKPEFLYEKHILKLQTMQGFWDEWISRVPRSKTNEDAYEATEIFFQTYFGRRRFKNYDSFRSSVCQWHERNRK